MKVDFGRTAHDYGRYRAGFPDEFFDRLAAFDIGLRGQRILDIGTGTGTLARGLARRGCEVTGLDPALEMLTEAQRLDQEAGVTVHYIIGHAETTGLATAAFDVVAAGQCWHWFDRSRAALEARRLLVPAGRLVIAHFDWIPLSINVVEVTEELILKHNPAWGLSRSTGLYPEWLRDAAMAGFVNIETFSFDVDVPYSHEAWRGRVRASSGVAASLTGSQVETFDQELENTLRERFSPQPLAVPHRVFALICVSPHP
jgi:SAM-dependent methyltransferase